MARTGARFMEVLWELARMCGLEPDPAITGGGLSEVDMVNFVMDLNRGYAKAYGWQNTVWEDAWTSGELTPVDGVVTFAQMDDASQFTIWTADPRPVRSRAERVAYKSSDAGVHVQTDEATVYAFWMPACPRWTVAEAYDSETDYATGDQVLGSDGQMYLALEGTDTYLELESSTLGGEPPGPGWRELTLLEVLREATLNFALSNRLVRGKEFGAARALVAEAEAMLEDQAAIEFPRVQTWWWIRRN